MPYQPAVTPNFAPIGQGITNAGAAIADGMESVRKEREKNEAADVTLEHLQSVSPETLEPYLRKSGDTETPSAELLSSFLGKSTRAKKEALIGAAAGAALMNQKKLEQGLEVTRVGYEGQRIQQNDRQFNESMRADKTKFAVQTNQRTAERKAQGKVDMVRMPDGSTMVVNGSGNFSVQKPAQPASSAPPAWAATAIANDPTLYWTGDAVRSKPADPMAMLRGVQPGAVQPGASPQAALPPLPQQHRTAEDVKHDGSLSREQKVEILRTKFGYR